MRSAKAVTDSMAPEPSAPGSMAPNAMAPDPMAPDPMAPNPMSPERLGLTARMLLWTGIVIGILLERYIIKGMAAGAVK